MSEDDAFVKAVINHGGWVATVVAGLGFWLLKKLFSAQLESLVEVFKEMRADISELKEDVGIIKGVLHERERTGHLTWPGDSR
jgi:hypothetical protein